MPSDRRKLEWILRASDITNRIRTEPDGGKIFVGDLLRHHVHSCVLVSHETRMKCHPVQRKAAANVDELYADLSPDNFYRSYRHTERCYVVLTIINDRTAVWLQRHSPNGYEGEGR